MSVVKPPRREILLSSRTLRRWADSAPGISALQGVLAALADKIDGFEIPFSYSDVLAFLGQSGTFPAPSWWAHVPEKTFSKLLSGSRTVAFLQPLSLLSPQSVPDFCQHLGGIVHAGRISYCTVQPAVVDDDSWSQICKLLPAYVRIGVENLSPRAQHFRTLEEVGELLIKHPRLMMTVDTCHLVENGYDIGGAEVSSFIETFANRIGAVHVSLPPVRGSGSICGSMHGLCSGRSDNRLSKCISSLPAGIPLVIEGAEENLSVEDVVREAEMLRLLCLASARSGVSKI